MAVVNDDGVRSALREEDRRDWQRHPVDVVRLALRLAVLGVLLALTAAFPSALQNVSADLVRLSTDSFPVTTAMITTADSSPTSGSPPL